MPDHLSPRRLAEAVGVSESSIKRWVDDGRIESALTAGGHRRIPLAAAINFVRKSGAELANPASLGVALAPTAGRRDAKSEETGWAIETLHDHVLTGRADAALALVRTLYLSGLETARIVDQHLRTTLERCGELWHDGGGEGVFLEHRATQIALRILHELRAIQGTRPASAPLALGGARSGDPYQIPTLAVATVLESVGFATVNLGPDTPENAFVSAIDNLRPGLVWLSLTSAGKPADLSRYIGTVGEAAARLGGSLVIGGRASPAAGPDVGAVRFPGDSLIELAAFARGLLHSPRSSAGHR